MLVNGAVFELAAEMMTSCQKFREAWYITLVRLSRTSDSPIPRIRYCTLIYGRSGSRISFQEQGCCFCCFRQYTGQLILSWSLWQNIPCSCYKISCHSFRLPFLSLPSLFPAATSLLNASLSPMAAEKDIESGLPSVSDLISDKQNMISPLLALIKSSTLNPRYAVPILQIHPIRPVSKFFLRLRV